MASTPTKRLRLDKQGTGDNPNAWGIRLNASLELLDESQGVGIVPVDGNVTLTSNNFTSDQARRAVLRFIGAGGFTVTVPSVDKPYIIDNRCVADVVVKTADGVGATVRAGAMSTVYVDGTDTAIADPSLDKIRGPSAALKMGGQQITGLGAGTAPGHAVTYEQTVGNVDSAAASAALAQRWAISAALVDGNHTGAREYALAAQKSAAAAALFDPSTYYSKATVDAKLTEIQRLASIAFALGG